MSSIQLTLLLGTTPADFASSEIIKALDKVAVTHDEEMSACELTFKLGEQAKDMLDYKLIHEPGLQPWRRLILRVTINGSSATLFDGVITVREVKAGSDDDEAKLTVTCDDVSVMLSRVDKSVQHPGQSDRDIVSKLLEDAAYADLGLMVTLAGDKAMKQKSANERIRTQQESDYDYIRKLAKRLGYIFYIRPGRELGSNEAYWGPPPRDDPPQKALTLNMGSASNVVGNVSFNYSGILPLVIAGKVQDSKTNRPVNVEVEEAEGDTFSREPAMDAYRAHLKQKKMRAASKDKDEDEEEAQGTVDEANRNVLTATGTLDTPSYGGILQPHVRVNLRGAGTAHDGTYYVKRVTHHIEVGEYRQQFVLTRDGMGATSPTVISILWLSSMASIGGRLRTTATPAS